MAPARLCLLLAITVVGYVCDLQQAVALPAFFIGGGTSAVDYFGPIATSYATGKALPAGVTTLKYQSTNTLDGIEGLLSKGKYYIGVAADVPTGTQHSSANVLYYTIPTVVTTFSFFGSFGKASGNYQLSALNAAKIFTGKVPNWSSVIPGVNKQLRAIVRSDAAAAIAAMGDYLAGTNTPANWPPSYRGDGPYPGYTAGGVFVALAGSAAVAREVFRYKTNSLTTLKAFGAITFLQTAIGYNSAQRLFEFAVQNKAGTYLIAGKVTTAQQTQIIGDIQAALPQSFPAATAPWSAITTNPAVGARTYPIVQIIYQFYRQTYPTTTVGTLARNFGVFSLLDATVNSFGVPKYFYGLPAAYKIQSRNAINLIR